MNNYVSNDDSIKNHKFINYILNNLKLVASVVIVVIIIISLAILSYNLYIRLEDQKKVLQINTEQLKDTQYLSDKLKLSPNDTTKIQREIYTIQSSDAKPNVTYTIEAPDIKSAADKVETQIRTKDPSAPSIITEKSDRAIVTPNTDKQKVDVYRINLNKNHKIKTGVTYIDNKGYASIGYQAGKFEGVIHIDPSNSAKIKGGSIMYTLKEW